MSRDEWLAAYRHRLEERGLDSAAAAQLTEQVDFDGLLGQDLADDPGDAADGELEQWGDDEGGCGGHEG